jgi:hypothetical protein
MQCMNGSGASKGTFQRRALEREEIGKCEEAIHERSKCKGVL